MRDPPNCIMKSKPLISISQVELHRSGRIGWLRAAVLGADDAIVSTASLLIGVAAASASKGAILVALLIALGTPDEIKRNSDPRVQQFLNARIPKVMAAASQLKAGNLAPLFMAYGRVTPHGKDSRADARWQRARKLLSKD